MILPNAGVSVTYDDTVLATTPIAYWPQSELAGATAHCLVNPLQDGTYTGVTLANDPTGPFGTPAPFYDGLNDYLNVQTATLQAALDGDEGTFMAWARVFNAAVWADGNPRQVFYTVDTSDWQEYISLRKEDANGFRWRYGAGGVLEQITDWGMTGVTSWMQLAITWSAALDEVRAFLNGAQNGATQTVLGVWAGTVNVSVIGASDLVPNTQWHGWLGPCAIWDRALTPAEVEGVYLT